MQNAIIPKRTPSLNTMRFSEPIPCDIFIVVADMSDWKTESIEMIREYMKPIPR